jgi:hypothetical protein
LWYNLNFTLYHPPFNNSNNRALQTACYRLSENNRKKGSRKFDHVPHAAASAISHNPWMPLPPLGHVNFKREKIRDHGLRFTTSDTPANTVWKLPLCQWQPSIAIPHIKPAHWYGQPLLDLLFFPTFHFVFSGRLGLSPTHTLTCLLSLCK